MTRDEMRFELVKTILGRSVIDQLGDGLEKVAVGIADAVLAEMGAGDSRPEYEKITEDTVRQCWDALGITSYSDAGGRYIWDHIADLRKERDELRQNVHDQGAEMSRLRAALAEQKAKIAVHERESIEALTSEKHEVQRLSSKLAEAQRDVGRAETELSNCARQLAAVTMERDRMHDSISASMQRPTLRVSPADGTISGVLPCGHVPNCLRAWNIHNDQAEAFCACCRAAAQKGA